MTYQKITAKKLINTGIEREIQIPLSPLNKTLTIDYQLVRFFLFLILSCLISVIYFYRILSYLKVTPNLAASCLAIGICF